VTKKSKQIGVQKMTFDSILQGFVDYANIFDTDDLPITLTVNGQIVTGRLISEQRYHQELKKTFGVSKYEKGF
jgi:hypothetical protein